MDDADLFPDAPKRWPCPCHDCTDEREREWVNPARSSISRMPTFKERYRDLQEMVRELFQLRAHNMTLKVKRRRPC
jgi:hypothetical protein